MRSLAIPPCQPQHGRTRRLRARLAQWPAGGVGMCAIFMAMLSFHAVSVNAYEAIAVENGGQIRGTVVLKGDPPPPQRFQLTMGAYPKHCRPVANADGDVVVPRALVSATGEVQDAVVFIQALDRGKPAPPSGPTLTVGRCRFDRPVLAGMDGSLLTIAMQDTVLHPLRGWEMVNEGRIPLFHYPVLEEGDEQSTTLVTRRSGMVRVECDQHRYMQTWILVPMNPYFSVTDAAGAFAIDDIPEGEYTVAVWHPHLGYAEQRVAVAARARVPVNFAFKTPPASGSSR